MSTQPQKEDNKSIHGGSVDHSKKKSKGHTPSEDSVSSSIIVELAKKRAEAESARVALAFTKRETEKELKKSEIEAELKILSQEKIIAMADTEVRVLEAMDSSFQSLPLLLPVEDPVQRTERYVTAHSEGIGNQRSQGQEDSPKVPVENRRNENLYSANYQPAQSTLNPSAAPYQPATDVTRFLLRKDLLLSRLINFDDKPENYPLWKSCFLSVIHELEVNSSEELDLLLKWLGPDSRQQVTRIRKASLHDPNQGLKAVWQRLDERYGSAEMVECSILKRIEKFPKLTTRDTKQLFELSDLASEVEALMGNPDYKHLFGYYDSSSGVNKFVNKLPFPLQERWSSHAFRHKEQYAVSFPPFSVFVSFIKDLARFRNDPSFQYEDSGSYNSSHRTKNYHTNEVTFQPRMSVRAKRTDVTTTNSAYKANTRTIHGSLNQIIVCPLHQTGHSLNECRAFQAKPYEERMSFLKSKGMCYKCCQANDHLARNCEAKIVCSKCQSSRHPTALHDESRRVSARECHGGENATNMASDNMNLPLDKDPLSLKCTQVCGQSFQGKSCAKNVLVLVYPKGQRDKAVKIYATIDDQSNASLCRSSFFDQFNIKGTMFPYTILSCGGQTQTSGRRASDFMMESLDGKNVFGLPTLIECNNIPDNKQEIPTPNVALHYSHLRDIAQYIPEMDETASIQLLLGRDIPDVHHVQSQLTGAPGFPYAQRLPLGWVIVGEACLGKIHPPKTVSVNKVHTLASGRPSVCEPCPNNLRIREANPPDSELMNCEENDIFRVTKDDDRPGKSAEDQEFIRLMDKEMHRNSEGIWVAPLPFKKRRPRLPNNRPQALRRAKSLQNNLQRNSNKRDHFIEFMRKIFVNNHAEVAPPLTEGEECWYLPIFGVYHPKKPSQIRAVFDSSATYEGVSLNSVLLQGPDLTNELLGILVRFRKEPIAVMADVQHMFHCFEVSEHHRNYLRFFWFHDNDPTKDLIEYRMRVHVFGNRPSPAVATYGLRKAAQSGEEEFGIQTRELVENDFYVDDAVASFPTTDKAINVLKKTQESLKENGSIRLHKVVSNSDEVMKAFPTDDLASNLKDIDFNRDEVPLQRSLGILWDIQTDTFNFQISSGNKPCTRRGILSTVHGVFDPLGFLAPVIIEGKMILRDIVSNGVDWDEPLTQENCERWERWKKSLQNLEILQIPRMIVPWSLSETTLIEVHVFSDASEKVISSVAYLRATSKDDIQVKWGFIIGKAKLAPKTGHTIPRLELCAAVLATEIALIVAKHLDFPLSDIKYHTDSKIVLGYISNSERRFSIYVTNRVARIRKYSDPTQWNYVQTKSNPADQATRPVGAESMINNPWLLGPTVNHSEEHSAEDIQQSELKLVEEVTVVNTTVESSRLGSHRFKRFSEWDRLVKSVSLLKNFAKSRHQDASVSHSNDEQSVHKLTSAELFIIKEVQREVYSNEVNCILTQSSLPKESPILSLRPFIDEEGMLRVGGRLAKSDLSRDERNPLVIPGRDHIALLLTRHHHGLAQHQGRHLTEGVIRAAGLWIVGSKRLISAVIHKCVTCRKLRGRQEHQIMADLPSDRLTPSPPFSFVGVDTFGPWEVVSRKTRGGLAHSKRWALLFTCLVTRAIHIEVVQEMSSSSFVNALRRFIALRGNVQQFRSDRGTNFVGATDLLGIDSVNVETQSVKSFLDSKRVKWLFNPPHASHMGGAWERLIGVVRRILENMMRNISSKSFTHEVLVTFMAEVCAIVNSRPITSVSSDPEDPTLLTPSSLLTQKTDHTVVPLKDCSGDLRDIYRKQWKQVQALADTFWSRFKGEYLQTLQRRQKWVQELPNIRQGDLVLLCEKNVRRNEWPQGTVFEAISSDDGKVRKVVVKVIRDGKHTYLTRPIRELILLLPCED